ncbi:hypothetical protein OYC64_012744 [Pagothenia borchgrevinki]|uniref:Uncharacterized protein n=1 Tax=Pagothenia borchgrevinki TaxID=8213 RepID=A0ABD2GAM9_PAGBO
MTSHPPDGRGLHPPYDRGPPPTSRRGLHPPYTLRTAGGSTLRTPSGRQGAPPTVQQGAPPSVPPPYSRGIHPLSFPAEEEESSLHRCTSSSELRTLFLQFLVLQPPGGRESFGRRETSVPRQVSTAAARSLELFPGQETRGLPGNSSREPGRKPRGAAAKTRCLPTREKFINH